MWLHPNTENKPPQYLSQGIGGPRGHDGCPTGPNSFVFAYIFGKKCPHWRSMSPLMHPCCPLPHGKSWICHYRGRPLEARAPIPMGHTCLRCFCQSIGPNFDLSNQIHYVAASTYWRFSPCDLITT